MFSFLWDERHPQVGAEEVDDGLSVVGAVLSEPFQVSRAVMLFASDFPAFEKLVDYEQWVEVFRSPDPAVLDAAGVTFTDDERALVLAGNARRVLGI
ncbi:hypothetical protein [Saccharopolyspora sp. NPDC050642]|uniref:hypothetical protein n=1 Tax=Saccharopolyspora sp. NPDC050642 TaxID=3157099 RepID=UPI00340042DD